jgi:hypothetical protein
VRPHAQQGFWTILFSDCIISAIVYLDMMELYAAAQLEELQPWVVLQQDSAPPHLGLLVRQFSMQCFQTDGLGGTVQHLGHHVHWTLPLWTFLLGYVKDKVYSTPVPDIDILKARMF